jgi:predicted nucleic acid-binding protein
MLVVDASCLYEVLADGVESEQVRAHLARDEEQIAPHIVDVEVLGVIRRHRLLGLLDETAAWQAVTDLRDWPGERFGHRALLERGWELRDRVRGWDAMYVALAEAMDATLLTLDARLGKVSGLGCEVEVISAGSAG